jgi:hypothetical protein
MKIISIDVGIKNLAFCLFSVEEDKYQIEDWGVVDLSQKTETQKLCTCWNDKKIKKVTTKEKCKYQAKWKKNDVYYCVKHAKHSGFLIPTNDYKTSFINKQNMTSLRKILDKLNEEKKDDNNNEERKKERKEKSILNSFNPISDTGSNDTPNTFSSDPINTNPLSLNTILYNSIPNSSINHTSNSISGSSSLKKADLISVILSTIETKCLQPIEEVNASKMDLVTIGRNMKIKFDNIFCQKRIDKVIIENQISPIANRMKTIQGMISQYFIMISEHPIEINFVNSTNKLKLGEFQSNTDYKERKQQSVSLVKKMVDSSWLDFFNEHNKKDDLADCYLQGIWYIKNKKNSS